MMTQSEQPFTNMETIHPAFFAGDSVQLAGQTDYPNTMMPAHGYPSLLIIPHATCNNRRGYASIARLGTAQGLAVFRWDKRGTGESAPGGGGDADNDAPAAYQAALSQSHINMQQAVIYAQNEGTLVLAATYAKFRAIQRPIGVILAGNMLDETQILAIDAPVLCIVGKNDWNDWRTYAEGAAKAHARRYGGKAAYFVAPNADRFLHYVQSDVYHSGALESIKTWLEQTCQISPLT